MVKTPKTKKIPCAFCQGKGVQPGAERLSCIVCGGRGRVTARQPYNICKECGGLGKKAGTNLYCLSCHGRGFIEEKKHPSVVGSSQQRKRTRLAGARAKRGRRRRSKIEKKKRAKKSVRKKRNKKPNKSKKGKLS